MKTVTVCKFAPLAGHKAEDTVIKITKALPRLNTDLPLEEVGKLFDREAEIIAEALRGALPQATLDRLTLALMAKHVSFYRGKSGG